MTILVGSIPTAASQPDSVATVLGTNKVQREVQVETNIYFDDLRRDHTRPSPKNVHFGKTHYRDLNIDNI